MYLVVQLFPDFPWILNDYFTCHLHKVVQIYRLKYVQIWVLNLHGQFHRELAPNEGLVAGLCRARYHGFVIV